MLEAATPRGVLREAVSEQYHYRYGLSVNPNNVLITPGGKPVIFFVASFLVIKTQKFYILTPDFRFIDL